MRSTAVHLVLHPLLFFRHGAALRGGPLGSTSYLDVDENAESAVCRGFPLKFGVEARVWDGVGGLDEDMRLGSAGYAGVGRRCVLDSEYDSHSLLVYDLPIPFPRSPAPYED